MQNHEDKERLDWLERLARADAFWVVRRDPIKGLIIHQPHAELWGGESSTLREAIDYAMSRWGGSND